MDGIFSFIKGDDMKNLSNSYCQDSSDVYNIVIGKECIFLPKNEWTANFCYIESLEQKRNKWIISFRIENEFNNDSYIKKYKIHLNKKLQMNMLEPNLTFFLPPQKKTVLIKVLSINKESILIRIINTKN